MSAYAELIRLEKGSAGLFGVLCLAGAVFCLTLEQQDRENRENVSCIPVGRYVCQRVLSPRFGETFEIMDVPNRSHILFHKGNVVEDTRGCVLLGQRSGSLRGQRAILDSDQAVKEFLSRCAGRDTFSLVVREVELEGRA